MNLPRAITAAFLLLSLGSCSRVFLVKAAFADGAVVFKSEDDDRTFYPWCWDNFTIIDEGGQPVWEFDVPYGAFSGGEDCGPNFPVQYGKPPPRAETIIAPRSLELDRLYVIDGHSAGLLEGAFKVERVDGVLKIRNLDPSSGEALSIRDAYYAWQQSHDPPRISQSKAANAAFVVQRPPETVPQSTAAGAAGKDHHTWVLKPDRWWNLPSLTYGDLSGVQAPLNLWCRYTGGPIYARIPPPATKDSLLRLTSGSHRLTVRVVGAGNPSRGDRVDAVLPSDSGLFESFASTGKLTVEVAARRTEANAIDSEERARVNRFFELCRTSVQRPSPTVEVTNE